MIHPNRQRTYAFTAFSLSFTVLAACDHRELQEPSPAGEIQGLLDDGDVGPMMLPVPPDKPPPPPTGGSTGGGMGGVGGNDGCSSNGPGMPFPPPLPAPLPGGGGPVAVDAGAATVDAGPVAAPDGGVSRFDAASGDGGSGPSVCIQLPLGKWELDDCSPARTDLRDSSFNNFTAFRTVGAQCAEGFEGQGLSLPATRT
jgi:hypothetical protein